MKTHAFTISFLVFIFIGCFLVPLGIDYKHAYKIKNDFTVWSYVDRNEIRIPSNGLSCRTAIDKNKDGLLDTIYTTTCFPRRGLFCNYSSVQNIDQEIYADVLKNGEEVSSFLSLWRKRL